MNQENLQAAEIPAEMPEENIALAPAESATQSAIEESATPTAPTETVQRAPEITSEAAAEIAPQVAAAPTQLPTPNSQPLSLPEADVAEPPRPLVAGAFLGGEFEVKDLVARGLTNFYLAFGGDYTAPVPKLVAEREVENASGHPTLESALFPAAQFVLADGREYLIFDWIETIALQDWREVSNDARYLQVMSALVAGMRELESKKLRADLTRETLRFDADGKIRFFGFTDAAIEGAANPHLLELREINTFLLRQVFGEANTIRLDDQWGSLAMSEEVKAFARGLESEYSSLEQVEAALQSLRWSGVLQADSFLLSDVGQEREINEDAGMILKISRAGHLANHDVELYVVSDGMGGHEGGEVASDLTLTTLQQLFLSRADVDWNDNSSVRAALIDVIEEVNAAVVALTESEKYRATRAKPGATLTFALRVGSRAFFGNVGDSRAYKWSTPGGLQAVTKDHSYVQTLIDAGEITAEQAFDHPDGSIITAHIGMAKLKQRDVFLRLIAPGDKIVIVSDGVTDMLREPDIAANVNSDDPRVVCKNLVDASNAAGGHDNITVVCVNFS